jgi:hypothetical protein
MASTKLTTQIRQQLLKTNSVETREHEDSSFAKDFKDQVVTNAKAAPNDLVSQILGIDRFAAKNSEKQSGELTPGQEMTLSKKAPPTEHAQAENKHVERKAHVRAGIDYFAEISRSSERSNSKETQELRYQINQIMEELQRIYKASSMMVQTEYAGVALHVAPSTPGKYHVNYFSWILSVIQETRRKVEDAGAWLAVSKKKNGFQAKAQKHGTKYTQSSERQAVTQTG